MLTVIARYRLFTRALRPVLRLWCALRALRQPIYRAHRSQRWAEGLPTPLPLATAKGLIWLHAVSVGETQACAPLLRALLAHYPQHAVLLTHMTPTGRDTGAAVFAAEIAAQRVQQCYLPYDVAGLPERFLQHFKPVCGAMMETEVWPNWVAACAAAGVPLGLANARLSEQSLQRALRFSGLSNLAKHTYSAFCWVAAQSAADAARLAQLRPQTMTVTGNLKFECSPNAEQLAQGKARAGAFSVAAGRTIIALASTREGEEALLLKALLPWVQAQSSAQSSQPASQPLPLPLLLLIPRHPKRASELVAMLKQLGVSYAQRSAGETPRPDTTVYLCDTLGEMWLFYGAADIAIVGGAWLPTGGQNLIEPCAAGCAVIVGPNMYNFAHATELAVAAQAVVQCAGVDALPAVLDRLNTAPSRQAMSRRATAFASAHSGATAKHLALIAPLLK
jgi:3-deoxy-D-manno-octulosonic-acid transferase